MCFYFFCNEIWLVISCWHVETLAQLARICGLLVDWQVTCCEVTFCQATSGQVTLFTTYLMDKLPYVILPFTTSDLFSKLTLWLITLWQVTFFTDYLMISYLFWQLTFHQNLPLRQISFWQLTSMIFDRFDLFQTCTTSTYYLLSPYSILELCLL